MTNNKNGTDNNEFSRIKPAAISLTQGPADDTAADETVGRSPQKPIILALALALIAVLAVIFLLPQLVPAPDVAGPGTGPADESAGGEPARNTAQGGPGKSQPSAGTPWSDAQLAKWRKQSQELLAQMLEAEEELQQHSVREWASAAYNQARQTAEQGDTAYQERRFEQAVGLYQQALQGFESLLESMDEVYQEAMAAGRQALQDGDSELATQQFERALLLRPGDAQARQGLQRAGTLDQVLALIADADDAMQAGELQQARELYGRALEIDAEAEQARRGLQAANAGIRENNFRAAMSRGFARLESGQLEEAKKSFSQAVSIKPGSAEAKAALNQVNSDITTNRINTHLAEAEQAMSREDWTAAVDSYRQALDLDKSLAEAQNGYARASRRAEFDQRLQQVISNPERLWDDKVEQGARALLQAARQIQPRGPRLAGQIDTLERLLKQAVTPVTVELRSDNQTSVTIYQVGEMGTFKEKSLNLMPGRYVAVGTRPDYRDVRVEFTVDPGNPPGPVTIATTEEITL